MQVICRNILLNLKIVQEDIYIRCGRSNGLQLTNPEFYSQCNRCDDPPVKRTKRKSYTKRFYKQKETKYSVVS